MRIKENSEGYNMWLSAKDTYDWAHRPGKCWLCSRCSGHSLFVGVDSNGLYDFTIDGKQGDVDGTELDAIISDFLPPKFRHMYPTWEGITEFHMSAILGIKEAKPKKLLPDGLEGFVLK